ncbi:unnamed protein product [Calicophoron daubneyi]|uniref:RNA helicase n=1 Tax=Calicophoron daubneyi TaxID=300641 RepID=A0AAV2TX80_CALDB
MPFACAFVSARVTVEYRTSYTGLLLHHSRATSTSRTPWITSTQGASLTSSYSETPAPCAVHSLDFPPLTCSVSPQTRGPNTYGKTPVQTGLHPISSGPVGHEQALDGVADSPPLPSCYCFRDNLGGPRERPGAKPGYAELGVIPEICERLDAIGWHEPTQIQRIVIPVALQGISFFSLQSSLGVGLDTIGVAETGSGKTGSFLIPVVQQWINANRPTGFALLLAPTRELAQQLSDEAERLGSNANTDSCRLVVVRLVGGEDMVEQALQLAWHRHHIIVATPGRLVDHMKQCSNFAQQQLSTIRHLVLDEADCMLSMAFSEDIDMILGLFEKPLSNAKRKRKESLLSRLSRERENVSSERPCSKAAKTGFAHPQTYLFSATMTKDVAKLRRAALSANAISVTCNSSGDPSNIAPAHELIDQRLETTAGFPSGLSHFCLPLRLIDKPAVLDWLVSSEIQHEILLRKILPSSFDRASDTPLRRIIVFCKRCQEARLVAAFLHERGHLAVELTGRMKQSDRKRALLDFASGRAQILVATDVASRGLDIPNVEIVINYSVPMTEKTYRHRVGRTARAGHSGLALTLVTRDVARTFLELEAALSPHLAPYSHAESGTACCIPRWPIPLPHASSQHGRLTEEAWSKAGRIIRAQDAEKRKAECNMSDSESSDSAFDPDLSNSDSEDLSITASETRSERGGPKDDQDQVQLMPAANSDVQLAVSGLAGVEAARHQWKNIAREKKTRRRRRQNMLEAKRLASGSGWGMKSSDTDEMKPFEDEDSMDHLRFDESLKAKYAKLQPSGRPKF